MGREASGEANLYLHNVRDILVLWAGLGPVLTRSTAVLLSNTAVLVGSTAVLLDNSAVLLSHTAVLMGNTAVQLSTLHYWWVILQHC